MDKPPIGPNPHQFVYYNRIKELSSRIIDWLEYAHKYDNIQNSKETYQAISKWAHEVESLAKLEAELQDRSKF